MTRMHGALNRATDGKAPILPPGVESREGEGTDASQPGFSVPWALDAETAAASGSLSDASGVATDPPANQAGFISVATESTESLSPEAEDKLVGGKSSDRRARSSVAIEQYRKLAATLHHAQAARGLKVIVVTSANPGEGKSLTASNLALTLSQSFKRLVLLVDGDLRRPALHDIFGVPNDVGLSDGLLRHAIPEMAVRQFSPQLSILPSGPPVEDPTGKLTSDQMRFVLDEARARYDWVIVDTPPTGLASDARLLAEMVDGVVLVVEAAKTGYPDLVRAIDAIGRERVLGVVLNRLPKVPGSTHHYYYSNYYRRKASGN